MGEIEFSKSTKFVILNKDTITKKDVLGETMLHRAVISRGLFLIKSILQLNTDLVHCENNQGKTPLHFASFGQSGTGFHHRRLHSIPMAKLLLDAGAKIDAKCADGLTPLAVAALHGDVDLFEYLCQRGADVNALTEYSTHNLHLVVRSVIAPTKAIQAIVELLVKKYNVDINMVHPKTKATAFYFACMRDDSDVAMTLMDLGADCTIKSKHNISPFSLACASDHFELAKRIHKVCGVIPDLKILLSEKKESTVLHAIGELYNSRSRNILRYLLVNDVNPNLLDANGKTILHFIVDSSYFTYDDMDLLAAFGIDPSIKDKEGRRAADCTKRESSLDILKLFDD